jgi:hypothetical protein
MWVIDELLPVRRRSRPPSRAYRCRGDLPGGRPSAAGLHIRAAVLRRVTPTRAAVHWSARPVGLQQARRALAPQLARVLSYLAPSSPSWWAQALYESPADSLVAAFIGPPAMNMADATVSGDRVRFAGLEAGRRPAVGRAQMGDPWDPPAGVHGRRPDVRFRLVGRAGTAGADRAPGRRDTCVVRTDAPRATVDAVVDVADDEARLAADDERARCVAVLDGRAGLRQGCGHAAAGSGAEARVRRGSGPRWGGVVDADVRGA